MSVAYHRSTCTDRGLTQTSEAELKDVLEPSRQRILDNDEAAHHPSKVTDNANFNMSQYRLSWCIHGYATPEYARSLGYLDFWDLFAGFEWRKSLGQRFRDVIAEGAKHQRAN